MKSKEEIYQALNISPEKGEELEIKVSDLLNKYNPEDILSPLKEMSSLTDNTQEAIFTGFIAAIMDMARVEQMRQQILINKLNEKE